MMNYSKAIKLLYCVKNPEVMQLFGGNTDRLECELECMTWRKFNLIPVSEWIIRCILSIL